MNTLPARCQLTVSEERVMLLVATGLPNIEIAAQLWLAEQTIKFHVSNVIKKLRVENRTAAVWRCLELGIIPPPPRAVLVHCPACSASFAYKDGGA